MWVGIDFGTTNSSLAVLRDSASSAPELANFPYQGGVTSSFRSILYMSFEEGFTTERIYAGVHALAKYLEEGGNGRILQSLKSFLSSASFESTMTYNKRYFLEDLISLVLIQLREAAEEQFGSLGSRAVVGRPVKFVGADDETLALSRLERALEKAGFTHVVFEYEPIAAASEYARRLSVDEVVLVADFGGGTTDFCLARVGPEASRESPAKRILGTVGVPIAGDAFDGTIVESKLASYLGKGSTYTSLGGKELEVPHWIYKKMSNWHELSFMADAKNLRVLEEVSMTSRNPDGIRALIRIIEENLGFDFYKDVERSKRVLTDNEQSTIPLRIDPLDIDVLLEVSEFESLIAPHLSVMREALEELLQKSGVCHSDVDRIFMTGGTSLVPAVRGLFIDLFGAEKLASGNELTSVASGLAVRAKEQFGTTFGPS